MPYYAVADVFCCLIIMKNEKTLLLWQQLGYQASKSKQNILVNQRIKNINITTNNLLTSQSRKTVMMKHMQNCKYY
jgi:hypothetical protein